MDIKIVDPHCHFWDLSMKKHHWLLSDNAVDHHGDLNLIKINYLLDDYLNESQKYKVTKAVHVQCGWEANDSVGESKWLQSIVDQNGYPQGIVAYVDFTHKNYAELVEQHLQYANVRGIRQIVSYDKDSYYNGCSQDFINIPLWRNNLKILSKYNLVFDLQIYPEQIDSAIDVLKENPNIIFVIDHFAKPKFRTKEYFDFWAKQLKRLSEYENVYLKLSGFGMHEPNWTVQSVKPYIDTSIECFSANRCMFASNFPVDKIYKTFDETYDIFFSAVKSASIEEKLKLFSGNAEKVYRI